MAWHLNGEIVEVCSCKSACPCQLGPAEPDQGWCSAALTFAIKQGQSDGIDLSGRTVLFLIDLPGDFASGNGTVRLYFDKGAGARQQQELEAIFSGKKGGPGAVLASLVSKWLPSEVAPITIGPGGDRAVTLGDIGHLKLQFIRDQAGHVASVHDAPVLGLIAISRADLGRGDGSRFAAPQMRAWDSGGHGSVSPFSWTV